MEYYISFDCATETLGYLIAQADKINITGDIIDINQVNVNFIKYGVIDLINGKTIAEVPLYMRMKYLRIFLDELMKDLDIIPNATIVIEKQPGINTTTPGVEAALYLYYAYAKEIITIGSSMKNTISFHSSITLQYFIAKYKQNHTANKHHTTHNLAFYCNVKKINLNLHQSLHNHLADAFMQLLCVLLGRINIDTTKPLTKTTRKAKLPMDQKIAL